MLKVRRPASARPPGRAEKLPKGASIAGAQSLRSRGRPYRRAGEIRRRDELPGRAPPPGPGWGQRLLQENPIAANPRPTGHEPGTVASFTSARLGGGLSQEISAVRGPVRAVHAGPPL